MNRTDAPQAATLIDTLLARGCLLSVNDSFDGGGEWTVKRSTDRAVILAALGTTDGDLLVARGADGARLGSFMLIYGNGPGELVADHADNAFCAAIAALLEA